MRARCPTRVCVGVVASALALVLAAAGTARAQWRQWGGPRRDFTCDAGKLAAEWPESGPRRLWQREIGSGHSSIVVDEGRLFTMCRRGEQDAVLALDAETGATVWERRYDAPTKEGMLLDFGPGPHSTPLIVGERVFTIGGVVQLRCLDKKTGEILWGHDLIDEMKASHLGRGYGASPIAYKDTIIINVGGEGVGLAAFRQDNGEVVWKSEAFSGGYPSPMIVQLDGRDMLVVALGADRIGLDPATGETLWRVTVDRQSAAIMSSPVWVPPDKVFFTAGYGGGSRLFQIAARDGKYEAEELWYCRKLKVHHGDAIRIGHHIYASSGDFGPAFLMAVHLADGRIAWRERGFAKATLLLADGKLIILDERGLLALATATPEGLEVHARAQVLEEKAWTVPTLVGTRLYLRDNQTIMALDLGAEPSR
jgi:outer membrane protein assembly factor BamB